MDLIVVKLPFGRARDDPGGWLSDEVNRIVAGFLSGLISGIAAQRHRLRPAHAREALVSERHHPTGRERGPCAGQWSLLAVVVMIAGYNVIFRPYVGSSYPARPCLPLSKVRHAFHGRRQTATTTAAETLRSKATPSTSTWVNGSTANDGSR